MCQELWWEVGVDTALLLVRWLLGEQSTSRVMREKVLLCASSQKHNSPYPPPPNPSTRSVTFYNASQEPWWSKPTGTYVCSQLNVGDCSKVIDWQVRYDTPPPLLNPPPPPTTTTTTTTTPGTTLSTSGHLVLPE
jgi:hypothetical protein